MHSREHFFSAEAEDERLFSKYTISNTKTDMNRRASEFSRQTFRRSALKKGGLGLLD